MNEIEFAYLGKSLEFPLDDSINILDESCKDKFTCIVSNSDEIKAEVVASEIDFYIKNSEDDLSTKIGSVKTLYEARMLAYDLAKYFDYVQEIGNLLLVISKDNPAVLQKLKDANFKVILLNPNQIEYIDGHLGDLRVGVVVEDEISEVKTDQILWFDAPSEALKKSGVYDFANLSDDEVVEKLSQKIGDYRYKNYITYDSNICQYHNRREDTCGKCADVCPTVAIIKDDEKKELVFSHIDCEGCGGCISVCPAGALDYTQMTRDAFYEIAKLYRGKTALVIPRKMENILKTLHVKLPKNVLPLAMEGEKYLHEAHLLTLLQESGRGIIFFTDFVSRGSKDAIFILNQIYNAKYKNDAITVVETKEELEKALKNVAIFENSNYGINEEGLKKREIFSARLSHLVGKDDFGTIKTGEFIEYGVIKVDSDKCTLCLSCVGACNVGALKSFEEDFSLRADSSICTTCRYCELSCPEKCIEIKVGEIPLNQSWFGLKTVAKDEMFECVMCKTPFATKKSVEKIANMMKPLFAGDEIKTKSLYCCADCKPKIMFEAHILNEQKEANYDKK